MLSLVDRTILLYLNCGDLKIYETYIVKGYRNLRLILEDSQILEWQGK